MTDITDATLSEALCDACEASGGKLLWANAARQFRDAEGIDLFQRELSRRGLLSGEALAAIRERRVQVGRRE